MLPEEIITARLRLRRWRPSDRVPFAEMNADVQVMEHFPAVLSRDESDILASAIEDHFVRHGFGLWAVEIPDVSPYAGFIGLSIPRFKAPFMPCVEIGWRLAARYWGCGYATEGACAAMTFGFETLSLREIVSFTTAGNIRSRRVMERLGMTHDPADDFDYRRLPAAHPLRRHVVYRLANPAPPGDNTPDLFA